MIDFLAWIINVLLGSTIGIAIAIILERLLRRK